MCVCARPSVHVCNAYLRGRQWKRDVLGLILGCPEEREALLPCSIGSVLQTSASGLDSALSKGTGSSEMPREQHECESPGEEN